MEGEEGEDEEGRRGWGVIVGVEAKAFGFYDIVNSSWVKTLEAIHSIRNPPNHPFPTLPSPQPRSFFSLTPYPLTSPPSTPLTPPHVSLVPLRGSPATLPAPRAFAPARLRHHHHHRYGWHRSRHRHHRRWCDRVGSRRARRHRGGRFCSARFDGKWEGGQ